MLVAFRIKKKNFKTYNIIEKNNNNLNPPAEIFFKMIIYYITQLTKLG